MDYTSISASSYTGTTSFLSVSELINIFSLSHTLSSVALAWRRLLSLLFGYLAIPQLSAPPPRLLLDGPPAGSYPNDTEIKMLNFSDTTGLCFVVLCVGVLSVIWLRATRTTSRFQSAPDELSPILESTLKSITQKNIQSNNIQSSLLEEDHHDGSTSTALHRASFPAFITIPAYLNSSISTETTLPGLLQFDNGQVLRPLAASSGVARRTSSLSCVLKGDHHVGPASPAHHRTSTRTCTIRPKYPNSHILTETTLPGLLQSNGPIGCVLPTSASICSPESSNARLTSEISDLPVPTETTLPGVLQSDGRKCCVPHASTLLTPETIDSYTPTETTLPGLLQSNKPMSDVPLISARMGQKPGFLNVLPAPEIINSHIPTETTLPGLLPSNGPVSCVLPASAPIHNPESSNARLASEIPDFPISIETTLPGLLQSSARKHCAPRTSTLLTPETFDSYVPNETTLPGLLQSNRRKCCVPQTSTLLSPEIHDSYIPNETTLPGLLVPNGRNGPIPQRSATSSNPTSPARPPLPSSSPNFRLPTIGAMQGSPTGSGKTSSVATTLSFASRHIKENLPHDIDEQALINRLRERKVHMDNYFKRLQDGIREGRARRHSLKELRDRQRESEKSTVALDRQERRRSTGAICTRSQDRIQEQDASKAPLARPPFDDVPDENWSPIAGRHSQRGRNHNSGDTLARASTILSTTTNTPRTEEKKGTRVRKRRKKAMPMMRGEDSLREDDDAQAARDDHLWIDFGAINRRRTPRWEIRNRLTLEENGITLTPQALEEKNRQLKEQELYLPPLPDPPSLELSCEQEDDDW